MFKMMVYVEVPNTADFEKEVRWPFVPRTGETIEASDGGEHGMPLMVDYVVHSIGLGELGIHCKAVALNEAYTADQACNDLLETGWKRSH